MDFGFRVFLGIASIFSLVNASRIAFDRDDSTKRQSADDQQNLGPNRIVRYVIDNKDDERNLVQLAPTSCDPNPCGTNAQCETLNGAINCVCPTNYVGDPFSYCQLVCVLNKNCPPHLHCSNSHCVDPCVESCGKNTHCAVFNHIAVCGCKETYTGDPYDSCRPIPVHITGL